MTVTVDAAITALKAAWRDYVTDGVPSSEANEPYKAEIRAAFTALNTALNEAISAASGNLTQYETVAIMNAVTSADDGQLAYVYNNNGTPSDAANGVYQWDDGASDWVAASWYFAAVAAVVQPLVDDAEAARDAAEGFKDGAETARDDAETAAAAATASALAQATQMAGSLARARSIGLSEVDIATNFAASAYEHNYTINALRNGLTTYAAVADMPDTTFTRALAAFAQTEAGGLTLFATGVARVTDKGLLIEASASNRAKYSEDFTNAAWADADPLSATVTSNTTVAPDGTTTADTLTSTGAMRSRRQAVAIPGGTFLPPSISLKAGTAAQSRVLLTDGTNAADTLVNWSGGVPTLAPSTGTWTVTPEANGFYRLEGTNYTSAGGATAASFFVIPDTSAGLGTVIAWGAQVGTRKGQSYIPTTSAVVTQPADRLIHTVPTIETPCLIFADFIVPGADGRVISIANSADSTNYINIGTFSGGATVSVVKDGVQQQTAISPFGLTAGTRARIAMLIEEDNIRICVNGGFIYIDDVADMPTGLDRIIPGGDLSGTYYLNSYLKNWLVLPGRRVSDDTLNALASGTVFYGHVIDFGPGYGHGWFEPYGFGRAWKQSGGPDDNRIEFYLGNGSTVAGPELSVRNNVPDGIGLGAAIYARNFDDTDGIQITYLDPDHPALRFSDAGPFLQKDNSTKTSLRSTIGGSFMNLQAKLTTDTAYTAGAPAATGYLTLYDSNGVAYKVPAVAA